MLQQIMINLFSQYAADVFTLGHMRPLIVIN